MSRQIKIKNNSNQTIERAGFLFPPKTSKQIGVKQEKLDMILSSKSLDRVVQKPKKKKAKPKVVTKDNPQKPQGYTDTNSIDKQGNNAKQQQKNDTTNSEQPEGKCNQCGEQFKSKSGLYSHIKSKHPQLWQNMKG